MLVIPLNEIVDSFELPTMSVILQPKTLNLSVG